MGVIDDPWNDIMPRTSRFVVSEVVLFPETRSGAPISSIGTEKRLEITSANVFDGLPARPRGSLLGQRSFGASKHTANVVRDDLAGSHGGADGALPQT